MAAQTGTRSALVCAQSAVATRHSPITSWMECFIPCKRDLGRETVILFRLFFFYFKHPRLVILSEARVSARSEGPAFASGIPKAGPSRLTPLRMTSAPALATKEREAKAGAS